MGQHGGDIYSEEIQKQIAKEDRKFLDFSANINPLGMPAGVRLAVMEALDKAEHYPDPESRKLKQALAEYHEVPEEELICGNGGADLIYRLAYGTKPAHALLTAPTFLEYEEALKQVGTKIHIYEMQPDYRVREDILEQMTEDMDVMFLCNPNNPTGILVEQELLLRILERAESRSILLVLDECFLDFTGQEERSLIQKTTEYKHLFILKSFTKMYAMPGIRLGYGVCGDGALLRKMEAAGQCWGVSVLASEAGIAALGEGEYKEKAITLVREERAYHKKEMEILGMTVWDGQADYLFFRTDGIRDLYDRLLPEGIMIRRCSNYRGLDETCYRVAVKDHEANGRLIEALKKTAR